jgi:hypothetical protein
MNEMMSGALTWLAGQLIPWHVAVLILVSAPVWAALRYLVFLCGLIIVVRHSLPPDRPEILRAYGTCWTSLRDSPGQHRTNPLHPCRCPNEVAPRKQTGSASGRK